MYGSSQLFYLYFKLSIANFTQPFIKFFTSTFFNVYFSTSCICSLFTNYYLVWFLIISYLDYCKSLIPPCMPPLWEISYQIALWMLSFSMSMRFFFSLFLFFFAQSLHPPSQTPHPTPAVWTFYSSPHSPPTWVCIGSALPAELGMSWFSTVNLQQQPDLLALCDMYQTRQSYWMPSYLLSKLYMLPSLKSFLVDFTVIFLVDSTLSVIHIIFCMCYISGGFVWQSLEHLPYLFCNVISLRWSPIYLAAPHRHASLYCTLPFLLLFFHFFSFCTLLYCSLQMRSLQIEGKTLQYQKKYELLYCYAPFIAMVWDQTCSISKIRLYMAVP